MVNSKSSTAGVKSAAKMPATTIKRSAKMSVPVSPTQKSLEDEVLFLRSQNKILKSALKAVKDTATEKLSKSYELVWYANNRTRYPGHKVSNWLDNSKEHSEDIKNLKGFNGDYHHGFNSGLLAASRMFKEHVDVAENGSDSDNKVDIVHEVETKLNEKIETSKKSFPNVRAIDFPPVRSEK